MAADGRRPRGFALPARRGSLTGQDATLAAEMDEVRVRQAEDLREELRRVGRATVAELGEAVVLSAFCVEGRLAEHPEWFRAAGDRWELVPGA